MRTARAVLFIEQLMDLAAIMLRSAFAVLAFEHTGLPVAIVAAAIVIFLPMVQSPVLRNRLYGWLPGLNRPVGVDSAKVAMGLTLDVAGSDLPTAASAALLCRLATPWLAWFSAWDVQACWSPPRRGTTPHRARLDATAFAGKGGRVQSDRKRPLCVDLDGTLIKSDVLWESLFQYLKKRPLGLFLLPFWVLKGKAHFKAKIAARVDLDPSLLPYSKSFLQYLYQERAEGRTLVLATASHEGPATCIAEHLGIFDGVYASDGQTSLSGPRKLARLIGEYGERGFDYAGNAPVDLEIWPHAAEGVLVNPLRGVRQAASTMDKAQLLFEDRARGFQTYFRATRVHQWLKNLLVFVPLFLAHRYHDPALVAQAAVAFLAFSFCASSAYLLNDLLDLQADRRHPTKRRRPFAAGDLSIPSGVVLMATLLLAATAIGLFLPTAFLALLALYYLMNLGYSLRFKQEALVGVLVLAGLCTLRILAGAAAVGVETSFWLLAFSLFLFLSLALVKRYSEMLVMHAERQARFVSSGRGYGPGDLETLSKLGTASGYLAVLVLALCISSDEVKTLYTHPQAIWLLCPLLLYWISRIWLMARRNEMHEDPVVFAIADRRSHLLALIGLGTIWAAL